MKLWSQIGSLLGATLSAISTSVKQREEPTKMEIGGRRNLLLV